jgi:S-adenosyl methyltransferase
MLLIVLHLIPDADSPYGIVADLLGALPSGSYLRSRASLTGWNCSSRA